MRTTDSAAFASKNLALSKKPRFVVELAFDFDSTDLLYLTSHADCETPDGVTVLSGLVETLSVTSQSLDPIKANSTIGTISFSAVDHLSTLTAAINSRYPTYSLRGKRVRVYVGYEGLVWSEYLLVQTQIVDKLTFTTNGAYNFLCADVQRTARKNIFDVKITNLYESITATQTAIRLHDTTQLETVQHGTGYTDGSASLTVGYVAIEKEKVLWKQKVETAITASGTDITLSGSTITSSSTDLSVFANGMQIDISGTASDDGSWYITGTPTTTSATVTGTFTGAASGTSYSITAHPQIYQCSRGWLNTKALEYEVDADIVESDNKPEVKEYVYLEMPAIQMLYAVLTGVIYGESATLPDHWHMAVSASPFLDTASFTGIGTDLWDPSDATVGFPARLGGQEKIDGKKFYEQQLCRLTGTFLRVRATGDLSLRRMANILHDSAFSVTLDDDAITSLVDLEHDMPSVYNQFQIDWNYDDVNKKYTRGEQIIDNASISAHGPAAVLTQQYTTLHGSSHTKVALYSAFDTGRDRYAGPPYRVNGLGIQHRFNALEVGDVVRLKTSKVRDCVTGATANLSMEVQQITVDWLSGVKLNLFGSSQKADPQSSSILTQVMEDSFYTSAGTNLATYGGITKTDVAGVLTITAGTLAGNADMTASGAIYYYDGDITIPYGNTLFITQNVQIRYTGTLTVNGRIDGVGAGLAGALYSIPGAPGTWDPEPPILGTAGIGVTMAGGGFIQPLVTHPSVSYAGGITGAGAPNGVSYVTLANGGTTLAGIPTELRGTSGGAGMYLYGHFRGPVDGVYDSTAGGDGGAGGAGLCLVGRGAVAGVNAEIDLSGGPGALGDTYVKASTYSYATGSGAGGAPGGLLILLDGTLSPETITPYVIQNVGETPVQGVPRAEVEPSRISPTELMYSFYTHGADHDPSRGTIGRAASMTRVQYIPAALDPEPDAPEEAPKATAITVTESAANKTGINIVGLNISATAPVSGAYRGSMIYISPTGAESWTQIGEARTGQNVVAWVPAVTGDVYDIRAYPVSIDGLESDDYIADTHTITSGAGVAVIGANNTLQTSATVGAGTSGQGVKLSLDGLIGYNASGVPKVTIDATTGLITAVDGLFSGHLSSATIQSGSLLTSGSFLTASVSAAATTINVYDTTDFATSGSGQIIDGTNDRDAFSWTGKTATTLTGCSGVLGHSNGAAVVPLSASSKSILVDNETNEMRFYGNRGDGTTEELASVGITQSGSDYIVGKFGSTSSGSSRVGVAGFSNSGTGVWGNSSTGLGVYGFSTSNVGILAISFSNTTGAFKIYPDAGTTDPSPGTMGEFYVRSDGVLRYHNGTSWKTVTVV